MGLCLKKKCSSALKVEHEQSCFPDTIWAGYKNTGAPIITPVPAEAKEITGLTIASVHNLAFYLWLIKEARQHIIAGDFVSWKREMVEVMKRRL